MNGDRKRLAVEITDRDSNANQDGDSPAQQCCHPRFSDPVFNPYFVSEVSTALRCFIQPCVNC
jgi:hypothetical protein